MTLQEGQVYEGGISLSGGDGPFHRWIVVSPFGKTHIHSIDDPLNQHCWPATLIVQGIRSGRLRQTGYEPEHPAVLLQRVKESFGLRDTHLSLTDKTINGMIELIQDAAHKGMNYTPYAVGELFAHMKMTAISQSRADAITQGVNGILEQWNNAR